MTNATSFVAVANGFQFSASPDATILEAARGAGIAIPHTCGGQGKCRTCRFSIRDGKVSSRSPREATMEAELGDQRLACQARVEGDCELDFIGPLRRGVSPVGEIQTVRQEGVQLRVHQRPNVRREHDRKLLVRTEDALGQTQDHINERLAAIDVCDWNEIQQGTLRRAPSFGSESYSEEEYRAARRREKLLYLNIEFTNKCNLACTGCFAGFGDVQNVYEVGGERGYRHVKEVQGPLIFEEICAMLEEGRALGVRTVDLIGGGEPLISELFFPIAERAVALGMEVEVFTNGTLITPEAARRMFELRVLPFVKLYSARSWVHDSMVGKSGAWRRAVKGIEHLLDAGYGGGAGMPMALETIVVRRNREDLPLLWRWARENGMIPYFERFVGCHYDGDPGALLTPPELKDLWEELWLLDRGEYGFTWPMLPIRVGYTCATNFYSLYVNYEGQVRPCSGVFIPLGDVRKQGLRDILGQHPVVKDLREYERPDSSFCAGCHFYRTERCPGCRGMAVTNGSHMADDPLCFHNPANLRSAFDPRRSPHLLQLVRPAEGSRG